MIRHCKVCNYTTKHFIQKWGRQVWFFCSKCHWCAELREYSS